MKHTPRDGDGDTLNTKELESFCVDMKLNAFNIEETLKGFKAEFEDGGISKKDFATFLCELCWIRVAKNNPKTFTSAFRKFITDLWRHTKTSLEIANVMGLPQVQEIIQKHKIALQQIFRKQSVTDSKSKMMFITKKKWTDLLSKYGVIGSDFGIKLAHQAFDVCNSDYGSQGQDSGTKMIYQEFVEALLAVAMIKNSNIFIPLSHRIDRFFDQLCVAATGRKIKFLNL